MSIKIIIYPPSDDEGQKKLEKKAATFHAQIVVDRIKGLSCPKEQKVELIERIKNYIPK